MVRLWSDVNIQLVEPASVADGRNHHPTGGWQLVVSLAASLVAALTSFGVAAQDVAVWGSVTASPNPCITFDDQPCAVVVRWHTSGAPTAQVWVSEDGRAPLLVACGAQGKQQITWILPGHVFRFLLHAASACTDAFSVDTGVADTAVVAVRPTVGFNKFDLVLQYLGRASGGNGTTRFQKVTQAMARKSIVDARNIDVTLFRVSATGFDPVAFGQPGDLDLWRVNPGAYFALFDRMMADLEANNVQIIPVFVWNPTQFPAMANETLDALITDPNSGSYQLLTSYVTEFAERYYDHRMLYFYELTNELNLLADLDMVQSCRRDFGDSEMCAHMGNFSSDQLAAFVRRLADLVRSVDPAHLISSGFSMPRPNAAHARGYPGWLPNGPDQTLDSVSEFAAYIADVHSGVDVISAHLYNGRNDNERFGVTGHLNPDLLGIVKDVADNIGKPLFVGEFGDMEPDVAEDPTGLFTQNMLRKIVELQIPFSAVWVWQFYQFAPFIPSVHHLDPGYAPQLVRAVRDANRDLGNEIVEVPSPDTIARGRHLAAPGHPGQRRAARPRGGQRRQRHG